MRTIRLTDHQFSIVALAVETLNAGDDDAARENAETLAALHAEPAGLIVTVDTGNAAFGGPGQPAAECARILREVAENITDGATDGRVRDFNGNSVGAFSLRQD